MTGDELKWKTVEKVDELKEKANEKIEETRKKLDEIKESISNFKNAHLSKEAREEELEKIWEKIQTANEEIKERADTLKDNVTSQFQTVIDSLKNEYNLLLSVWDKASWDGSFSSTDTSSTDKKKWFFESIGDWFQDKRDNFKNKDDKEKGKTVWLVAVWGLATRWIFSYFSKEKREKRKEKRRQKREARRAAKEERRKEVAALPFWDRPFWKFLKWTAIWAAVVWWVYWLFKLLWWGWNKENPDGRSSDEEKLDWYEEEIVNKPENKEKFENYEDFWKNIDTLYSSIYERELEAWYEDELEMQKIAKEQSKWEKNFKWIIPYCLDNQFKNVDNILWQNSSMKEAIANWLHWMINYIKSKWNDFLQMFVNTYLDKLPSWLPFKNIAWSLSDKIDQWKVKNENAASEMQYFFRQSIRVQTYLFEKRDQLIAKIVKESASKYGISEEDIVWDDENLKKYVINTPEYQNFINGPISSAVTVLKNYNIFDCEISKEKKEDVKELDIQRNKVLWCNEGEKDILVTINEKKNKWETLTQQDEKKLWEACDWIIKDIDDNILDAVDKSAWTIYEDLFWLDDSHLRKYLDKSWLEKIFREYKQIIEQKKLELQWWKLSNEDKIALAESINAMLALKKEAVLWSQTIEKDYDENWNPIFRIPWFLRWSVKNLWESVKKLCHKEFGSSAEYLLSAWLWTWVLISSAWIFTMLASKWRYWFWAVKRWAKIAVLPAWLTYEWLKMVRPVRHQINKINYPFKFRWEWWPKKLMALLKDGEISLSKASEIVRWNTLGTFLADTTETRRKDFFYITNNNENVTYKIFDKLITEWSNTAAWATYLQSIKSDKELYETLVNNYDISKEIRRAVSENAPIEELRRVAQESNIPELMRNNSYYKKIAKELSWERNRIIGRREFSELSNAERKQLDSITDFQKALATMDEKQIETTAELLWEFKRWWSLSDAISQLAVLKKLDGKGIIIDTWLLDSSGKPITKNLDDIIKEMNVAELRRCKWKISWVTDDAIESLAKIFENVKANKILKFSDNIDEIWKALKVLFKLVAKAT